MATVTATLAGERWLDEVLLQSTHGAIAGAAISEAVLLPAGIGDVAIMNVVARVSGVDVGPAAAASVPRGIAIRMFAGAGVVDNVGVAPWYLSFDGANVLEYFAFIDPDALVLWRQNDVASLVSPEMDSDATPLGSLTVYWKCVRVRPPAEGAQAPLQLVR